MLPPDFICILNFSNSTPANHSITDWRWWTTLSQTRRNNKHLSANQSLVLILNLNVNSSLNHLWTFSLHTHTHTHRDMQQQNGSFLHSNTLRVCRGTLPISGTPLRTVDFWRGKHTLQSTRYQLMPLLPTPPPATLPFTEGVFTMGIKKGSSEESVIVTQT